MARNVRQSPGTMHGKLMLLINSACGGCSASSGTSLFPMQNFGREPVSHSSPQPSHPGISPSLNIARVDNNTDAKKILFVFPTEGRKDYQGILESRFKIVQNDWKSHNLTLTESLNMAPNCPLRWLLAMFCATHKINESLYTIR